ncbi:MAG TPA: rRNA maturation RNase YbeY [Candidatus Woesebacteria bacterium]|nr:rRNA maturation RNase YbeY [Candidatus Woesebacteria bacterium]HPJ17201.1 rRNA maturation RNase YbeY [Candidatus Woesebacteria bacterium]
MENIVLIRHPKNWGLNEDLVLKYAQEALKKRGLEGVILSIYFVGQKKAKELNIQYRQKSYIPQVLGFPMDRTAEADGLIRLGDVVICSQKVKYEMKFLKKTEAEILAEWLLHGVDNLLKLA